MHSLAFLFQRSLFVHQKQEFVEEGYAGQIVFSTAGYSSSLSPLDADAMSSTPDTGWNAPTIDDLNEETKRDFDRLALRIPRKKIGKDFVQKRLKDSGGINTIEIGFVNGDYIA